MFSKSYIIDVWYTYRICSNTQGPEYASNTKNAILHSSREEVTKSIFILPVLLFSIQDSHQDLHYSILTDTLIASIAIFRQSL